MACWRETASGIELYVRAQPNAPADRIAGIVADASGRERLRVQVTAAPEDGKANAAVCKLLAKALKIRKSALTVTAGATARSKTVAIEGATPAEVRALAAGCGAERR